MGLRDVLEFLSQDQPSLWEYGEMKWVKGERIKGT